LAYLPIYYFGIAYLRTGVWTVRMVGLALMALMALELLQAGAAAAR